MTWHVQYRQDTEDCIVRYPSPELAIEAACRLIDAGCDVYGIGTGPLTDSIDRPPAGRPLWMKPGVCWSASPAGSLRSTRGFLFRDQRNHHPFHQRQAVALCQRRCLLLELATCKPLEGWTCIWLLIF